MDDPTAEQPWAYQIGATVKRRAVHLRYGGQRQSGIVTPAGLNAIIVFTDPDSGSRYGYDKFEGQREDGSYSYTGEGQRGDQVFTKGNKRLRDAATSGDAIHLFRTNGSDATYVGLFTTADPAFRMEQIPDVHGGNRAGIVFNLLPVRAEMSYLPVYAHEDMSGPQISPWVAPNAESISLPPIENGSGADRSMSRIEFILQKRFGEWAQLNNLSPAQLRIPADSAVLVPDFFIRGEPNIIIEAKQSPARHFVRAAIGQVLDYVNAAEAHGIEAQPAILLPSMPASTLRGLISNLGITLYVTEGDGFKSYAPALAQTVD